MSMTRRRWNVVTARRIAAAWIAAIAIVAAAGEVMAQQEPDASSSQSASAFISLADVERLFWSCDYVATTRGVDSAPVDVCSAATEELKNIRFGGDFMALLEWWRGNKPAEHARLSRLIGEPAASEQADGEPTGYQTAL
jgi:hypothetical protein